MTIKQQNVTFLILVLLAVPLGFYYFFIYAPLPPNVEIVVAATEYPDGWLLSPNGDKIFYLPIVNEQYKPTLLFLDSYQRHEMGDCGYIWWVNNTLFRCQESENAPTMLVNTNDFTQFPIQTIETNNPQLTSILQHAGKIYRYKEGEADSKFFFVLSEDKNKPNENYQINSTDIDTTLKGYTYTTISTFSLTGSYDKFYSPDKRYYFQFKRKGIRLSIYDATTDQKIVEYPPNDDYGHEIEVGGWAWDSSGVYFKGYALGIMARPPSNFPILKLVIPK